MSIDFNKSDIFVMARGAIGCIGAPVDVLVYALEEFESESLKCRITVKAVQTDRLAYGIT